MTAWREPPGRIPLSFFADCVGTGRERRPGSLWIGVIRGPSAVRGGSKEVLDEEN